MPLSEFYAPPDSDSENETDSRYTTDDRSTRELLVSIDGSLKQIVDMVTGMVTAFSGIGGGMFGGGKPGK